MLMTKHHVNRAMHYGLHFVHFVQIYWGWSQLDAEFLQ